MRGRAAAGLCRQQMQPQVPDGCRSEQLSEARLGSVDRASGRVSQEVADDVESVGDFDADVQRRQSARERGFVFGEAVECRLLEGDVVGVEDREQEDQEVPEDRQRVRVSHERDILGHLDVLVVADAAEASQLLLFDAVVDVFVQCVPVHDATDHLPQLASSELRT